MKDILVAQVYGVLPCCEFNTNHVDYFDLLEVPDSALCDYVPSPLMQIKVTTWRNTGQTSLMVSVCHATGSRYGSSPQSYSILMADLF